MTSSTSLSADRTSTQVDDVYRKLNFIPRNDKNTLAVPLMIAHLLWWSSSRLRHTKPPESRSHSASLSTHHDHGSSAASSCAHSHSDSIPASTRSKLTKIGCAFEKCFFELRFFLSWDERNLCLSVDDHYESHIDKKLREYHYYNDAYGHYQEALVPKYSTFTTCEHGHQSPTSSFDTPSTKKCSSSSASKKISYPTSNPTLASTSSCGSACSSAKKSVPQPAKQTTNPAPASSSPASVSGSKPATTMAAKPVSTTQTKSTATSTAKPKATSARRQQKMPEQVQSPALLSDCRRFPGFAESNAEQRSHLSRDASLAEVIGQLNRAVLEFGVSNGDTLVWVELASLVALFNYAAAFYTDFADGIESYMQHRFGNIFVDHYFRTVYCNRASYIEREEFGSEGCPDAKNDQNERKTRRDTIETSFTKMVPDVTELRDGVQTVLFTFIWINYTAYKGYDAAMTATLQVAIPLLETVIVRCARQMYLMQRALTAAQSVSAINSVQTPEAYDLQWDLLDLSAALQNLSGCDLALFTSDCYEDAGVAMSKLRRRERRGWVEKIVSCPYSAHLYTAAVSDITLRTLLQMHKAVHSGTLSKPPIKPKEIKCPDKCTCPTLEERMTSIIDGVYKRMTLIERKQYDWKPLLIKKKRVKKVKKKGEVANGKSQAQKKDDDGKEMMLRDILSKRIDEFKIANMMLKGPSEYAYFTDAPQPAKSDQPANTSSKTVSTQTTSLSPNGNVLTTTVNNGSTTITATSNHTDGSVSVAIAPKASTALAKSIEKKMLAELKEKPSSFSGTQAEWVATMKGPFSSTTEPDFSQNPAYQAFRMALGELPVTGDAPACLTEAEREAWLEGSYEMLFEAMGGNRSMACEYRDWATGCAFAGDDDVD